MAKKDFKKNTAELFLSTAEPEEGKKEAAGPNIQDIPKGYMLVKENKSERMQLLVRPTLKEAIKKEAQAQGISMNDLINNIFEEYLDGRG